MSLFGQTGSAFGQPPQGSTPFGQTQQGSAPGFSFGSQTGAAQNPGFGAKPVTGNTTATNTSNLFGSANNQQSSGLFGQSNTNTGLFGNSANNAKPGGLFGGSAPATPTASTSGGLFASNTSNTNGGGLFGNTNTNTGGLFGNANTGATNANTGATNANANTGASSGGLFGSNTSNTGFGSSSGGLFGSANTNANANANANANTNTDANTNANTNTNTSGGLFGNTNTAGGLFGKPSTGSGSGLFGSNTTNTNTNTGGLFGSANANTTNSGGLFGTANTNSGSLFSQQKPALGGTGGLFANANNQQPATPLVATVDQASYMLPGVAPATKLYTSLTNPVTKRTVHDRDRFEHEPKLPVARSRIASVRGTQNSHWKSALKPGMPAELSPSLLGAHRDSSRLAASAPSSRAVGEPRKWINSYDSFIRERPTTLVIDRSAQTSSKHHLLPASTAAPPVAVAPPVAAPEETHANPDVSLFHRQANNIALVQMDPRAVEEGYFIYPRLDALASMSKQQLSAVSNLVIGRENYGQIEYSEPVDLSHLKNLGDILGKLVVFTLGSVCVYPEGSRKAPRGRELNIPAAVSIENAWPKDAVTHKPITNMEDRRMAKYIAKLKRTCEESGSEFVTFTNGIWVFKVPHFSTWGLRLDDMIVDDDDEDEDEDEDTPVIVDPIVPQGASSPILGALDTDVRDDDVEILETETAPPARSWLEQLQRAGNGVLLAKPQSLEAASQPTDKLDLSSILMPQPPRAAAAHAKAAEKSAPRRSKPFRSSGAIISQLRGSLKVAARQDNDLPLLHSSVDFARLSQLLPDKSRLWQLLSILYESGNTARLVEWFDGVVAKQQADVRGKALETTWNLLCKHDVQGAYKTASVNNPHLALLISLLSSKETHAAARSNAQHQLSDWKATGFVSNIPAPVRRIWQLAAGDMPPDTGLSWEQWVGMHLWYLDSSVRAAVDSLPAALATGGGDLRASPELAFLQCFSQKLQLRTALSELDLLESFLSLQAFHKVAPEIIAADAAMYDDVCLRLAEALQQNGEHISAVFIGLHIRDAKKAMECVRQILCELPASLDLPAEFGVRDHLVHEARAFQVAERGEYFSQCEHLVRAGMYEDAHKVLIAEVAPRAVLANDTSAILPLLKLLSAHKAQISGWEHGGGAYLTYAAAQSSAPDDYSIDSLCNACRYMKTPTLSSREAVSRIAVWVASTPFAQKSIDPTRILGMKFSPSEARIESLEQAAHLLY